LVAVALVGCGSDDDAADESATTDSGEATTDTQAADTDDGDTDDGDGSEDAGGSDPLPIEELCGDGPLQVAHVAGFGGNSWRQITNAELEDELSACPNVTMDYTQADGDLQKYITALNTYTAQGYDVIVTYNDFGSQGLGAIQAATQAGVVVVPYIGDPEGEVGVDYAAFVGYDSVTEGQDMANWLADQVEPGATFLFSGGLEGGSTTTAVLFDSIIAQNEALGSPLVPLTNAPQASNWDPAFEQQAMAGALAQYPEINALASDYGAASKGGLRSFVNAGRPIPPLATSASDNELGCMWLEMREDNPDFELLTLDGTTTVVRIAARKALAAVNGLPDNEPELFVMPAFIDTANGQLPECRDDLPPDVDLSSALPPEKLAALFGG
jgi:ribose transport system substrate-binding protein